MIFSTHVLLQDIWLWQKSMKMPLVLLLYLASPLRELF